MPTIDTRITTGSDDVEQRAGSGSMTMDSSDLELTTDGTNVQIVGLRFLGIDIPQGAVITSAYIQFQTDEVKTGATSLLIRGEDTGDAAAFATTAFNVSSRVTTDASVGWTPDAWSTVGQAGLAQRTPEMTAIVQEIVSRSDWAALNDMVFLISGSGTRTAEAYESGAATAPLLHIEYTLSGPVVGNVSINDVSVTEGNSGTSVATFTVSRTGSAPFSVDYATANGSATAGSDYAAIPLTTLNFAQGEASKTLSVTINGDTLAESNETFSVNLSNAVGSGASIADGTGAGTILDDDTPAVVGNISINDVSVSEGNSGTKLATFTVSRTGTAAFSVNYATSNGSATAGSDYTAIASTTLNFAQGEASKTLSVTINGDTTIEGNETFSVNLSNAVGPAATIADGTGLGTITNDDAASIQAVVRNIWSTTGLASPWGSGDPSALAYVPGKGLYIGDSEAEESPYYSSNNMFLVQPNDGGTLTRIGAPISLMSFTSEPTGLAYVSSTDLLYISDDDADRVYWVDPDNPQVKLGEFKTSLSGSTDAEGIAYDGFDGDVNGGDGHLYIANGIYHNFREVTIDGTLVRTIAMPSAIKDPDALFWDDVHNVFFVGGKFSSNIWVLDRNGAIIDTITLLNNYDRPGGAGAKITDLELAPSSNSNDDPARLSLYVADYGADQVNDGRLFEIDLGSFLS
jgi:Calx-beta domain